MNETNHEINLALRTAAGHERAAREAEEQGAKTYEMKMISAGASAYAGFVLAIKAAPEYQGRKIDDAAIQRIYQSTKPRPWWDKHLAAVKVEGKPATREWGARVIQWHLDPDAAKARRAKAALRVASAHKALKEKANRATHGVRTPQAKVPTTTEVLAHAAAVTKALQPARELPRAAAEAVTLEDLLGDVSRINSTVRKVKAEDRAAVQDILRVTAREIERYVR
jgi:hypothetical protein